MQDRAHLWDGEGLLPPSLLADLMSQIRCDAVSVERYHTIRQVHRWLQSDDEDGDLGRPEDWHRLFWTPYWDCLLSGGEAAAG
jgi:hypothetical protein